MWLKILAIVNGIYAYVSYRCMSPRMLVVLLDYGLEILLDGQHTIRSITSIALSAET